MAKPTSRKQPAAKKTAAKKTAAKQPAAKKTAAKKPAAKKPAATADGTVHCYRLIFQVDPGGSRKAESFVAGTLDEAKAAALDELESGIGAYHALFYGEEIVLQCWEGSTKVATIDLHPYITYELPDRAPLRFKPGQDALLDMDDDDNEALMTAMCDEELDITVTIAWDKIRLPALRGRPLRERETIVLEDDTPWKHGFHEHWDMKIDW
jgi:hypothetical protein